MSGRKRGRVTEKCEVLRVFFCFVLSGCRDMILHFLSSHGAQCVMVTVIAGTAAAAIAVVIVVVVVAIVAMAP